MLPLPPRSTRTDPLLPYTTFCRSSPIPPNFSIRSSRMTSIGPPSLLHDIGEQADVAGALDRTGQLALLLGGHRGDPRRDDLAALRQVTLEQAGVLVVVDGCVVTAYGAAISPGE